MDSNWTDPYLFAIYSIVRPIASTLILVFMYLVITMGQTQGELFAYLYVGNAFYMFVFNVLLGTFWVVQGDREWHQTIRYIYISPISYYIYVVGRAMSQVLITAFAVTITLAFGYFALNVPIGLSLNNIPLFSLSLILGLMCISAIGLILGGLSFLTARHIHGMNEGVVGIFYLFCGVIFPLSILPDWGQGIAKSIPLTYWFEVTRRVLLPFSSRDAALASFPTPFILILLVVSTAIFFLVSIGVFKLADYLARKAGKIDMTTAY